MPTAKQAYANQQNSQHSTGPKTEEGKSASAATSFKHGLASGQLLSPGEKSEEFEALHKILADRFLPTGDFEKMVVLDMAKYKWLCDRAIRLQAEAFDYYYPRLPEGLAVLVRYQVANERLFQKAIALLATSRKEKANPENGFVPQARKAAAPPAETSPARVPIEWLADPPLTPPAPPPPSASQNAAIPPPDAPPPSARP
jgi:hypothetical protein